MGEAILARAFSAGGGEKKVAETTATYNNVNIIVVSLPTTYEADKLYRFVITLSNCSVNYANDCHGLIEFYAYYYGNGSFWALPSCSGIARFWKSNGDLTYMPNNHYIYAIISGPQVYVQNYRAGTSGDAYGVQFNSSGIDSVVSIYEVAE